MDDDDDLGPYHHAVVMRNAREVWPRDLGLEYRAGGKKGEAHEAILDVKVVTTSVMPRRSLNPPPGLQRNSSLASFLEGGSAGAGVGGAGGVAGDGKEGRAIDSGLESRQPLRQVL